MRDRCVHVMVSASWVPLLIFNSSTGSTRWGLDRKLEKRF